VENATRLFLGKGYDGTSMESVAAASGVPRPTLYKRFPDKQALLRAVLEAQIAKWTVVSSKREARLGSDLKDRLAYHLSALMSWAMKPEVRAVTRLAFDGLRSAGMRGERENFFAHNDMLDTLVNEIVRYGSTQGLDAKDPDRIARALMSLVAGWLGAQEDKNRVPADAIRKEARFFVDLITLGQQAW
jgi:AcrR family transcriptional regulator